MWCGTAAPVIPGRPCLRSAGGSDAPCAAKGVFPAPGPVDNFRGTGRWGDGPRVIHRFGRDCWSLGRFG